MLTSAKIRTVLFESSGWGDTATPGYSARWPPLLPMNNAAKSCSPERLGTVLLTAPIGISRFKVLLWFLSHWV